MAKHTQVLSAALVAAADHAAALAERLPRAVTVMQETRGPSMPSSGDSMGSGGVSDPTGAAAGRRDRSTDDLRRVETLIRDTLDALRRLDAVITTYSPPPQHHQTNIWCENHIEHGHEEVRGPSRRVCTWCATVQAKYGVPPNADLIDAHYRRPRLSEQDYRRLLKLTGVPR